MHHNAFQKMLKRIFVFIVALKCAISGLAQPSDTFSPLPKQFADHKIMLIINSNYDDEPWANEMARPILMSMAQIDSIQGEFVSLNNTLIKSEEDFQRISDNIFARYESHHPSYLVLIGSFAFNLRDRIKKEWGDIPILLLTRTKEYSPLQSYFSDGTNLFEFKQLSPLSELREDYNFTLIYMPDYYKHTIDMIVNMKPDMKELVLLSDDIYVNRRLAYNITNYMLAQYPQINFKWLRASEETADSMRQLLANEYPDKGILLSSWAYERLNAYGHPELTCTDLRLLSASKNPIFSLRDAYKVHGVLGGVYSDGDFIDHEIVSVLDSMLKGKSMHDIPFFLNEKPQTKINYRLLGNYDLDLKQMPEDTVYVAKPQSYWERNIVEICLVTFVILFIISLLIIKNRSQKRQIHALNRNKEFLNTMPVPYATAIVYMSDRGELEAIDYDNMNDAYENIIKANTHPEHNYLLLPHDLLKNKIHEMLKTKKIVKFSHHFPDTDTHYDFLLSPSYTKPRKGMIWVDIFCQEITHRHKMEQHMKLLAEKLNLTLEIAKVVPWQLDFKKNQIVYRTYSHYIHNYGNDYEITNDIEGNEIAVSYSAFLEKILPEDRAVMAKYHDDLISGKIDDFYAQYRSYNDYDHDALEWIEIIGAVTQRDSNGKPAKITGAVQVITDRKIQEEKMEKAIEKANESDKMKSAFLANMSHEIRTPLNAIVGFSNLIATMQDENERLEFVDIINRNNDLLLNLINDVLDFAKIESNNIDFSFSRCNVNDIISSVKQTMQMRIPKDVRFNAIVGADELIMETDQNRLTQLLINLISNACKFTTKGNITFGYELQGQDSMYFFVKDSGIGISQEKQKTVFDRFVKLNTFVQGTGLGLSICKSIVEKMGGKIGVESSGEGKGSTFWFVLPLTQGLAQEEQPKIEQAPAKDEDPHAAIKAFFKDKTGNSEKLDMLIAEDNASNFKLMEHILKHKFNLVWAQNGEEAVEAFSKQHFDIVLLDISMPIMDGYEALKEIRQMSATVPVIAVTAYAYASDRKRIFDSGFNGYVSKPVSLKSLKEALRSAIGL